MPSDNNTFVDSSSNNFALTRFGNTTQGSFSPFSAAPGYWSNYFDGSGDFLTTGTAVSIGTQAFTIEAWIYIPSSISGAVFSINAAGSLIFGINSTQVFLARSGVANDLTATCTVPTNQWNHIICVRSGTGSNQTAIFVNGLRVAQGTVTTSYSSGGLVIGARNNSLDPFQGYISNTRFVLGSAIYNPTEASITVPTTPLVAVPGTALLTCQDNRFIDNSNNNYAITRSGDTAVTAFAPFLEPTAGYWSNYFDGSGDYLSIPNNTAFDFGTGDFTVEFWMNPVSTTANGGIIIDTRLTSGWVIHTNPDNTMRLTVTLGAIGITSSNTFNPQQWNHIALVRSGNTFRFYINGVSANSSTITNSMTADTVRIGIKSLSGSAVDPFNGYISNLRMVKGTALYTTNFTPSTTPLTAVSGTSLLTCQNRTFTDGSTNLFTITPVGNVTVNGFGPFTPPLTGYWSNFFNGSTDYLTMSAATVPLTGNFTIEGWVNASAIGARRDFFSQASPSADVSGRLFIYINASGSFEAFVGATPSNVLITHTATVTTRQWYHFAFVRESNVFRFYINGVAAVTQPTNSVSIANFSTIIGTKPLNPTYWSGYISNVRVTSSAVYTANFTPSATPPLAISGTSLLTCQDSALIDRSTNSLSITRTGSVVGSQISPYSTPNGYWSNFFDGTGDYLTVPDSTAAIQFGSGDFTVECWIYMSSSTNPGRIVNNWSSSTPTAASWEILSAGAGVQFNCSANGTSNAVSLNGSANVNSWNHIAGVRNGNVFTLYVNGVSTSTITQAITLQTANTFTVGSRRNGASYTEGFAGYISNLRIVKGTALYTTNFTPSTIPLTAVSGTSLLTCQSNRFVDNSTNNFAITSFGNAAVANISAFRNQSSTIPNAVYDPAIMGGSIYFDGSGDYLTVPSSSAFAFGSGNFTVEAWVYINAAGITNAQGNRVMTIASCLFSDGSSATAGWSFDVNGSASATGTGLRFENRISSTQNFAVAGAATITNCQWNHVAVVRNGTTITFYLNGINIGSGTLPNQSISSSNPLWIGRQNVINWTSDFNGHISNLRIVKGTAVYTSNFTPPTTPVTAISDTSLLLNGTNAGIVDLSGKSSIETVGDAKISTALSTKGTMLFDGTGDYLKIFPKSGDALFGTGDFTIEMWLRLNAFADGLAILSYGWPSINGPFLIYQDAVNNRLSFYSSSNGSTWDIASQAIIVNSPAINTWYHIAICRHGNFIRLFSNGTLATTITSSAALLSPASNVAITIAGDSAGARNSNVHINDLRMTKGIARYTANFTPPTRSSA